MRTLVTEFKRASNETTDDLRDKGQSGWKDVPESTQSFIAFSDAFAHVVDSSPKTYLAKVCVGDSITYYIYFKVIAWISNKRNLFFACMNLYY